MCIRDRPTTVRAFISKRTIEGIIMTERTTILQEVGQAFRENGLTAAITALVGGSLAVAATETRKAFTNEAMLERLDRELHLERERIDKQRAEDRKADADRLERIETDIRAMRDVMFDCLLYTSRCV